MLLSNIINDGIGLLSKQLRFYCWHFRRDLDQKQRQELIDLLYEQHFERLANKIRALNLNTAAECKQQITKLLFEQCLTRNRRHQLIQLIESKLVDINVRLDNYGRTLLHRSAYNLDVELVKILIEQDVNLRLRDYAGNTALHIAIQSYRNGAVIYGDGPDVMQNLTSIIQLLLDADRNLQNERFRRKRIKLSLKDMPHCQQIDRSKLDNTTAGSTVKDFLAESQNQTHILSDSILDVNNNSSQQSLLPPTEYSSLAPIQENSSSNINQMRNKSKLTRSSSSNTSDDFNQPRQPDVSTETLNPILLEDVSTPLVDTKNAFGRTALHYCVLVVGERHLSHFVKLLISCGADTDAIDTRMKTPLYCLVKRPGITAVREKFLAINHLLENGCDDLGLAIDAKNLSNDERFMKQLEQNQANSNLVHSESPPEPIFTRFVFKRVPSLKHIARLQLIRDQDRTTQLKRQRKISLPPTSPPCLNFFVNRRILDQSELF